MISYLPRSTQYLPDFLNPAGHDPFFSMIWGVSWLPALATQYFPLFRYPEGQVPFFSMAAGALVLPDLGTQYSPLLRYPDGQCFPDLTIGCPSAADTSGAFMLKAARMSRAVDMTFEIAVFMVLPG